MFEEVRRVLLAGIGGAALTGEKANKVINQLVEKGRLTVDEGKELTNELIKRKDDENEVNRDELQSALLELNFAQQEDIADLENRINKLEEEIRTLKTNE